uniref:Uncharacterized protein n=1 Tax=Timema shepardi TaxID=629360 RepID=A0A7R9FWS9_TIMSH|nr:unnamed protein product [Timema shepardi]
MAGLFIYRPSEPSWVSHPASLDSHNDGRWMCGRYRAVELNTTSALANYAIEAGLDYCKNEMFSTGIQCWGDKKFLATSFSLVMVKCIKVSRFTSFSFLQRALVDHVVLGVTLAIDWTADGDIRVQIPARNKPADGSGHVNQKGQAGQKAPVAGQKGGQTKPAQKPPTAQKGQVKAQPKAAAVKGGKKNKKGQRHQQHDLIVTIDLVSLLGERREAGSTIMGREGGWEHDHGESVRGEEGVESTIMVSLLGDRRGWKHDHAAALVRLIYFDMGVNFESQTGVMTSVMSF